MKVIKCNQCKDDIDGDKIFVGAFQKSELIGDSICGKSPILGSGSHFCSSECFIEFLQDFFNKGIIE